MGELRECKITSHYQGSGPCVREGLWTCGNDKLMFITGKLEMVKD